MKLTIGIRDSQSLGADCSLTNSSSSGICISNKALLLVMMRSATSGQYWHFGMQLVLRGYRSAGFSDFQSNHCFGSNLADRVVDFKWREKFVSFLLCLVDCKAPNYS